jgi:hypothetical protein
MSRGIGKIERAALAVLKEKAGAFHINDVVRYSTNFGRSATQAKRRRCARSTHKSGVPRSNSPSCATILTFSDTDNHDF